MSTLPAFSMKRKQSDGGDEAPAAFARKLERELAASEGLIIAMHMHIRRLESLLRSFADCAEDHDWVGPAGVMDAMIAAARESLPENA